MHIPARPVTSVLTNAQNYVTFVVNPEADWSPRSAADVVLDIELGACTYYVDFPEGHCQVVDAGETHGRYLRADRDTGSRDYRGRNVLLDLPRAAA